VNCGENAPRVKRGVTMRIAMFQDTWRPTINGVITSTELFKAELERQGHEVVVVVPDHAQAPAKSDESIVRVPAVSFEWVYPGVHLGQFWRNEVVAKRLIPFRPDIIHSMTEFTIGHWMSTYWQRRLGNLPRVHTFHTLWSEYLFYLPVIPVGVTMTWMRWAAPRAVRKHLRAVIAPSSAMKKALHEDWCIGDFPIHVVSTGIQVERFQHMVGERFRATHHIGPDENVILYLGRLGDEKNVELVVKTMGELRRRGEPNLRFVIAGGGPTEYVTRLQKLAAKEGLKDILFTGFITGQDWLDCYGAADLFLFPSTTETQGLVVIEALAAGVPMVSVRAMGPSSVMEGERGCLFAENDPKDFADKAQLLLHDATLYDDKRTQGLALAEQYSIEKRTRDLVAVYESALLPRELVGRDVPRLGTRSES
jgi:1,2-diacylglycerol 3-alpha-glucosyltransferase